MTVNPEINGAPMRKNRSLSDSGIGEDYFIPVFNLKSSHAAYGIGVFPYS